MGSEAPHVRASFAAAAKPTDAPGASAIEDRAPRAGPAAGTAYAVILSIAFCHLVNDMLQALLPAIYPSLKSTLGLSFAQLGLVTLTYQIIASILQPIIGLYADRRPTPLALSGATVFLLAGLVVLANSRDYAGVILGACLLGTASSVFHPEASRVARMAAGTRHGFAQSVFQVGGNAGQALGPLAAALVVVRWGQTSLAYFGLLALLSGALLWNVGVWYRRHGLLRLHAAGSHRPIEATLPAAVVRRGMLVLLVLVFSKFVYLVSLTNYFTLYLIQRFGVTVQAAQLELFAFSAAVAIGTVLGGPFGDRIGRKRVIWFSILGTLPFTLLLPHVSLFWTGPLVVVIGVILASAFPAIVVFAQELMPGKVGMVSGLFFGFAFGVGGLGAAALGVIADHSGIERVYQLCAFLPALGLFAALLPSVEHLRSTS